VVKPQGKSPLGRPRRRWEDNIKVDLQEVECGGMDWIEVAQYRDRFDKMREISSLAWNRLASQDGLCCMESVSELL